MDARSPLFTIVTVVLNDVKKVEGTIRSVLLQKFSDYEYIVVDGGSTDGTLDVIGRYRDRIDRLIAEPDRGIYDAMNKGIREAKGKWINFMNSGDTFADENVLRKLADAAVSERWDILYGDVIIPGKNGERQLRRANPEPCNIHRMFCCHQSTFVRTSLMKAGGFDINHPLSADFTFFKQCFVSGCRFRYVGGPVAIFDKSGISNVHRVRGLRDNVQVIKELDQGVLRVKHLVKLYYTIGYLGLVNLFRSRPSQPDLASREKVVH